ncbi:MAG: response regulator [Desulfobulbaceae bacterium]|nr:response regulator [Desulfobulbaceae bacterium]
MNILLIGNDSSTFAALAKRLRQEDHVHLVFSSNGAAGLEHIRQKTEKAIDLVVIDEHLPDMTGIEFVRHLVRIDPLVHTAVIGSLPDLAFHEATEGLGILLQLPPQPREQDAEMLLAVFGKITVLMQPDTAGA